MNAVEDDGAADDERSRLLGFSSATKLEELGLGVMDPTSNARLKVSGVFTRTVSSERSVHLERVSRHSPSNVKRSQTTVPCCPPASRAVPSSLTNSTLRVGAMPAQGKA